MERKSLPLQICTVLESEVVSLVGADHKTADMQARDACLLPNVSPRR